MRVMCAAQRSCATHDDATRGPDARVLTKNHSTVHKRTQRLASHGVANSDPAPSPTLYPTTPINLRQDLGHVIRVLQQGWGAQGDVIRHTPRATLSLRQLVIQAGHLLPLGVHGVGHGGMPHLTLPLGVAAAGCPGLGRWEGTWGHMGCGVRGGGRGRGQPHLKSSQGTCTHTACTVTCKDACTVSWRGGRRREINAHHALSRLLKLCRQRGHGRLKSAFSVSKAGQHIFAGGSRGLGRARTPHGQDKHK